MAFSDEDLERLKIRDVSFHLLSPVKKDALIARLEAAEAHMRACDEFHGFDKNDQPFVNVWLKAAGRTE